MLIVLPEDGRAQSVRVASVGDNSLNMLLVHEQNGTMRQYLAVFKGSIDTDASGKILHWDGTIQSLQTDDGKTDAVVNTELKDGDLKVTTQQNETYIIYDLNSRLAGKIRKLPPPSLAVTPPSPSAEKPASPAFDLSKLAAIHIPKPTAPVIGGIALVLAALLLWSFTRRNGETSGVAAKLKSGFQWLVLCLFVLVPFIWLTLHGAASTPPTPGPANATALASSPLKPKVTTTEIARKFMVRVGGGANISPPDTFGGGDGIPLISISSGSTFMPGEVQAPDERTKLIRLVCDFENPKDQSEAFKIGDVALIVGKERSNDFIAVGYDSKLCAMSDEDRKTVKQIAVEVPAKATRTLSFVFPLTQIGAREGSIVIGGSAPVSFEISTPEK